MIPVQVQGAGPAGAAAALSALAAGAPVRIYERSRLPRHKVCGEFLSHEIVPWFERLGVWNRIQAARPAEIRRVTLFLGRTSKTEILPAAAMGLSRYVLDDLLAASAVERGAELIRDGQPEPLQPLVIATGRRPAANDRRDDRLFGFKAHFRGPANDAVELYFFGGCYVGVNAVEGGFTNVCGLGPRHELAACGFDITALVSRYAPLRERLATMEQAFDWLHVGPLVFQNVLDRKGPPGVYPAGDALSFVDPFTGSGQLCAVLTGTLAGDAAAKGLAVSEYLRQCRSRLGSPIAAASLARKALATPIAPVLARLVPTGLLYRLTRPRRSVEFA